MKVNTWEEKDYEENLRKLRERFGADYVFKRWHASIDGPWYDDSNPEGRGDTEEEAVKMAMDNLQKMYGEIAAFLQE